jgi:regulator of protease activity HflC (stomatin/prohibitin superfamily)
MKPLHIVALSVLTLALLVTSIIGIRGCESFEVNAGYVGYVYSKPMFSSGGGFVQTVAGPTRWAITWRKYVIPIDVKQMRITEKFKILTQDEMNIDLNAHIQVSARPDRIRELVETYKHGRSGKGSHWYNHVLQEKFRTAVRKAVVTYKSREAKQHREDIAAKVLAELRPFVADTPFRVHSVVIGNLDFPKIVQDAVEQKMRMIQKLEEEETKVKVVAMQAKARVEEARGIAQAQEIVNGSLTPLYIQHEYVQALLECANSPNTTVVYIPTDGTGIPVVRTSNPERKSQ